MIQSVDYKIDVNTLDKIEGESEVEKNDICKVKIKIAKPLMVDGYAKNKGTGSIIIVDNFTNETVGAGMII
jgi:sulfate adenylyltransferase subunit 1